jgi:ParB-like chromosome segregation protein Spo0J
MGDKEELTALALATGQEEEPVLRGFHPLSELFPRLDEVAFADLVADIKLHGLREPITLNPDGLLLDGRHRLWACKEAGVPPLFRTFSGHAPTFVLSANVYRRHLDTSQRAMIAARLANMRQGERTDLARRSAKLQKVSRSEAADILNVSERLVADAQKVQRLGVPELVHAVETGELAVSAAATIARRPQEAQREVLAQSETSITRSAPARRTLTAQEKVQVRWGLQAWAASHEPGDAIADLDVIAGKLDLGACDWYSRTSEDENNSDSNAGES